MVQRFSAAPARPLFLISGADSLRVRLRAHELARSLARGATPTTGLARLSDVPLAEMGVTRLSARSASAADLLMATAAQGLFASAETGTALLVEDAEALADPALLAWLPRDAAVVLLASTAAATLEKAVRDLGGTIEVLGPLDGPGVEDWLRARARVYGVALDESAVAALAAAVGSDLERAERELEKLRAYAAGAVIRAADVRALVAGVTEQDVFELTRAVVRRDVAGAIGTLERLLDSGEPPLRLHGLLVWQFRLLLVAAGVRSEEDLERAVKRTGLSRPALQRWRREAQGVRPSVIARAYEALYNADLAMKTSVDARAVFQLLVLDLCGIEGADLGPLAARPPTG